MPNRLKEGAIEQTGRDQAGVTYRKRQSKAKRAVKARRAKRISLFNSLSRLPRSYTTYKTYNLQMRRLPVEFGGKDTSMSTVSVSGATSSSMSAVTTETVDVEPFCACVDPATLPGTFILVPSCIVYEKQHLPAIVSRANALSTCPRHSPGPYTHVPPKHNTNPPPKHYVNIKVGLWATCLNTLHFRHNERSNQQPHS